LLRSAEGAWDALEVARLTQLFEVHARVEEAWRGWRVDRGVRLFVFFVLFSRLL
jgi:hypothetical protein